MGFLRRDRRWRSERRSFQPLPASLRHRLLLFRVLVVALFAILAVQLFRLQLIEGSQYRSRAAINTLRVEYVAPERGLVYDRAGRLLVKNIPAFSAAVVPADLPISRQEELLALLDRTLNVRTSELWLLVEQGRASKDPYAPVIIKEQLDEEEAFVTRELMAFVPGLQLVVQPTRRYEEPELLAHILGYMGPLDADEYEQVRNTGYRFSDRIGKAGLEFVYEDYLRGRPGRRETANDASGRVIGLVNEVPAIPGDSIRLSIDLDLQAQVAAILQAAVNETGSMSAAGLLMDVHTGELLAMVSLPSYDNNLFSYRPPTRDVEALLEDPRKPLIDHAMAEMYPPGSIFKQITGLAALQERVVDLTTTFVSNGALYVKNQFDPKQIFTFPDWKPGIGAVDFSRAIAVSSDVYFYYAAGGHPDEGVQGVEATRLAKYARMFGLGTETGIDLPGESAGLVPDPQWKKETIREGWVLGDTYHFAIGQGYLAVTPLQMLVATAAVANGGDVLRPRVVKEVLDARGNVTFAFAPEVRNQVDVDQKWFEALRAAMVRAVNDGEGTAAPAAVEGVQVAGKTGTAEYGLPGANGEYQTHGWFAGFAPAGEPEVAIIVFLQRGGGHNDAAPVGREILDYYFNTWKKKQPS